MTTAARRRPIELFVALSIAACFHGGMLLAGSFRQTYDAYVHLFFADHYQRSWFSSWEPRWYTGFTTVSYPPGSHQLLALAGRIVGLDNAFPPVALAAMLLLIVGIYRFSCIWVSPRAAGYAALLAAVSSSLAETLHVFGQLPTLVSLSFLLNGLPFAHRWIRTGGIGALTSALACAAATTAAHHVTTLFGVVFFVGPVGVHALLDRLRTPLADEASGHAVRLRRGSIWPVFARRLRRVGPAVVRAAMYLGGVMTVLVLVVLPYWLWSSSDPITQIPIPHASRDSFLANPNAGLVFFAIPWGLLLVALPYALIRGMFASTWPLAASLGLLSVLGTGGTTPIPRMLLGGAFEVLTLDRFTFWGTIVVLPFAGQMAESLLHGRLRRTMLGHLGVVASRLVPTTLAVAFVVMAVFSANLGQYRPLEPAAIDTTPIVQFLDKDQHARWRYLTLGFGDQMAWLSAQTTAESVDGNYHSARRLPELTSTPVERLEGAKYSGVAGLGSLQQFLANSEKYHLKFVFSNDHFYDPLLAASGWQRLEPLENGVDVWQRDDVSPLPDGRIARQLPVFQRLLWGLLPPLAMAAAVVVLCLHGLGRRWPAWLKLPPLAMATTLLARLDGWLAKAQGRIALEGELPVWATWIPRARGWARRVAAPVAPRRRRLQLLLGCALLVCGSAVLSNRAAVPTSPTQTVYTYYDRLDLRDLTGAYRLLDPDLRPSLDQFLVERSVVNGLVASFARLARIQQVEVDQQGDRAVVRGELVFVTSLSEHLEPISENLRRIGDRWFIEPHAADLAIPPDQLVTRPSVGYLSQGRRQVTTGVTAYHDVVDRPEVQIPSARLVVHDGQLSVVGEVANIDVDPAYLTVTATLLDTEGEELSTYTSAVGAVHTALPGEVVPFRVDFEGVAGLDREDLSAEFIPGARTPLAIDPSEVAEVVVSAKALVTSLDLDRSLTAQAIRLDAGLIAADVRNDGLEEVTVPHVFVTLRDAEGRVGWVDDVFLANAVRPQRSIPMSIAVTPASSIQVIDVPVRLFANSLESPRLTTSPPLLGSIGGWSAGDLTLIGFTRSVG